VEFPFEIGALYKRRETIHSLLGGQQQGGISTPSAHPFVIAFTGEAGEAHGYTDFWDDDGYFHYYGEGQKGDMEFKGGNLAIKEHVAHGKRLLLFQMMGKGMPCRYRGEFVAISYEIVNGVPDTNGALRNAIVFKFSPIEAEELLGQQPEYDYADDAELRSTVAKQLVDIRKKQTLFRRRLLMIEKGCRLTGIRDLRFLRASHIKPWSKCTSAQERTDGENGLLLAPHADLLFDRGWISFEDDGRLLIANGLPKGIGKDLGLNLVIGKSYGNFAESQRRYLDFHRTYVFEHTADPPPENRAT